MHMVKKKNNIKKDLQSKTTENNGSQVKMT